MSQRRKEIVTETMAQQGAETGQALLARPLTARSIIASLLLGMHPPRLASSRLVRWCSLFGVSEGTARVALSRMVERGELTADDGIYELAGSVRRRQRAQDWVLAPTLHDWDGSWMLGVVAPEARSAADRAALRAAADRAHLAEVREGLWARPDNVPRQAAGDEVWAVLDEQCAWWRGQPDEDGPSLVTRLFTPAAWIERAEQLIDRLEPVTAALADGRLERLAEGFVTGAAALQHVRRDPLLPDELVPEQWPGDALRRAYAAYRDTYGTAVGAWFAAQR
jgi:phenylacetic acid degradation operon negative regulatory protein